MILFYKTTSQTNHVIGLDVCVHARIMLLATLIYETQDMCFLS